MHATGGEVEEVTGIEAWMSDRDILVIGFALVAGGIYSLWRALSKIADELNLLRAEIRAANYPLDSRGAGDSHQSRTLETIDLMRGSVEHIEHNGAGKP
jgi:hypothetical protein